MAANGPLAMRKLRKLGRPKRPLVAQLSTSCYHKNLVALETLQQWYILQWREKPYTCSPQRNFCKNKPLAIGARPTHFIAGVGGTPLRADWFANPLHQLLAARLWSGLREITLPRYEKVPPFAVFYRKGAGEWTGAVFLAPRHVAVRWPRLHVYIVAQRNNVLIRSLVLVALSPFRDLINFPLVRFKLAQELFSHYKR